MYLLIYLIIPNENKNLASFKDRYRFILKDFSVVFFLVKYILERNVWEDLRTFKVGYTKWITYF